MNIYGRLMELGALASLALTLSAFGAPDAYENDNLAGSARPIANGQVQNHSIHAAGDTDWVSFTIGGNGGLNLVLETSGTAGDTQIWLFGPNNATTCIAYDDNTGAGNFSQIEAAGLRPGQYFAKIREYGNNGAIPAYTLRVAWTTSNASYAPDVWEVDNLPGQANALGNSGVQGHSIHVPGDVDWAKISIGGSGARNLVIDTYGTTQDDTQLWLFGPDSSTTCIAYDDNSGVGNFSQITAAGVRGGTYYVKVKEYGNNGAIPNYVLRASWTALDTPDAYEPDNTAGEAHELVRGESQHHSIHVNGDTDWFSFTVTTAGAMAWLESYGTTGDTEMWLFGPDNAATCIAYDDNSGNDACARIYAGPLRAGTYYFKIKERGNNDTIDGYDLYVNW